MSHAIPIIAVTGSSGAGTTTVMQSFEHIFRREGIKAAGHRGRLASTATTASRCASACAGADAARATATSATSGPEANLLAELEQALRAATARAARGQVRQLPARRRRRRASSAARPGTFTPWQPMPSRHRPAVLRGPARRATSAPKVDIARHVDLLVGVVPIINLEWIQKLHRDQNMRGYSQEAVVDTILRRMPDYVNHICPQFSRTHVNFQRVPTVDTQQPVHRQGHPERRREHGGDPLRQPARASTSRYLLSMLHDSWMTRPNNIVVPGGKMGLAMQLIFTPMILRLMDLKQARLTMATRRSAIRSCSTSTARSSIPRPTSPTRSTSRCAARGLRAACAERSARLDRPRHARVAGQGAARRRRARRRVDARPTRCGRGSRYDYAPCCGDARPRLSRRAPHAASALRGAGIQAGRCSPTRKSAFAHRAAGTP